MNKMLTDLLYRSFDDELSKDEQNLLDTALKDSPELSWEKQRILHTRKLLADQHGQKFSPQFADNVMRRIRTAKDVSRGQIDEFFTALVLSFRRIAIAGTAGAALILAANFITGGDISLDTALALEQITIEDALSFNDLISGVVK